MKTEVAIGWGARTGSPVPYISHVYSARKDNIVRWCHNTSQRPVKVVLVPLAEYRRLKRIERDG